MEKGNENLRRDFGEDNLKKYSNLKFVLESAINAKNCAHGTSADDAGKIVDTLLLRNILAGRSICQIQKVALEENQIADFCSIAVLARSIMEGYLAIHYFCGWDCSKEQMQHRVLWWNWHEKKERLRTLKLISSKAPGMAELLKEEESLKSKIPKQLLMRGKKRVKHLLLENSEIAAQAGILKTNFELHYQQMSAVAHSQPVLIKIMMPHNPQSPDVIFMLEQAMAYATAYLAFSVRDYSNLVTPARLVLDVKFLQLQAFWSDMFATPFPED